MVDGNLFNIPLSPPTSPRLSQYNGDQVESSWEGQQPKDANQESGDGNIGMVHSEVPSLSLDTKPMLRSHKSFPYTLRTAGLPDTPPLNSSGGSPSANEDVPGDDIPSAEMPSVTFGGSAPASPISNLTPTSPTKDGDDEKQDLNGLNITLDPTEEKEKQPLSAAEIRAQKRKMKRFRLTHNQTRFLMSEFARQAHPDAAHRERLAREIPGLSPRQVQVWFQNRRAKLKRLTSDDRERMMRSRALPDDFDMTQALHSPFGAIHNVSSNLNSPSYSMSDGNVIRPLNLESLRRIPDGSHMSPTGISPSFGGFNFTPPQSVTDTLSPVSPAGDSPFSYSPTLDGQRRGNPFAPVTSPSTFTSHPQIPRLQLHDRVARTRSESLTSPLRTSLSYPGHGDDRMANGMNSAPIEGNNSNGMMPYGIGYSYPGAVPGFAATAGNRMRSFSGNMPRHMDLNISAATSAPTYSPTRSAATPHTATFPNYTSSPMATPNSNAFGMMSAPHHITSFPNSYLRQEPSPTEQFPSVGELVGDSGENGENVSQGDTQSETLTSF